MLATCLYLLLCQFARYEWAEEREVKRADLCEAVLKRWPDRFSFFEGCLAYFVDPERGGDEDDDGNDIE